MIFKLTQGGERSWHRLRGHGQLSKAILSAKLNDGIDVIISQAKTDPARHQDSAPTLSATGPIDGKTSKNAARVPGALPSQIL